MFATLALHARRAPARLARVYPARVLTVPRAATVELVAPRRARVRVDGMVCAACAARTGAAFRGVPGVRAVSVDLDAGVAMLELESEGAPPPTHALQRALDRVVVARWARRLLARASAATSRRIEGMRP